MLSAATSAAWVLPLVFTHWNEKRFFVVMPPFSIDLRVGLTHVELEANCLPTGPRMESFCATVNKVAMGRQTLRGFRDTACNWEEVSFRFLGGCDPVDKLWWVGIVNIFAIFVSVILAWTGMGFLAWYWYASQKRQYRRTAEICLFLAPVLPYV